MLLELLQTDHLRNITGMNDVSAQTLTSLANLRAVSRCFQQHVHSELADVTWAQSLTQRAFEYCNNLAPGAMMPEGQAHNVRLQELLANGAYKELCTAMQTFMIDAHAQEQFLQMLQNVLTSANPRGLLPNNPLHFRTQRTVACQTAGLDLFGTVARSLRLHHRHLHIAQLASEVLSLFLNVAVMSSPLRTFIIEALISALQAHPLDSEIRSHSLATLWRLTHSGSQMTIGAHNMTQVIADSMMVATPLDTDTTILGVRLLHRYIDNVFPMTQQAVQLLQECDVPFLEGLVLDIMRRQPLEILIARHGLMFMCVLYDRCLNRTVQHERAAQCAVDAIVTCVGNRDVVGYAVQLLHVMVPCCWLPPHGPAYSAQACTRLDASVLIPVCVFAVRLMAVNAQNKLVCAELLGLLFLLCQNHLVNAQSALRHHVVLSLADRFSSPVATAVDDTWARHHARLQALLLPYDASVQ
jgi:hypothetical protein